MHEIWLVYFSGRHPVYPIHEMNRQHHIGDFSKEHIDGLTSRISVLIATSISEISSIYKNKCKIILGCE